MDPYQLIKEAEFIDKIRTQYERSPAEKIPGLRQARRDIGLRHLSPNLEAYLDNMHGLQKVFLNGDPPEADGEIPLLDKVEVEKVGFGFIAQCDEDDLYDEDGNQKFSPFQSYQSCVIVVSPRAEGRLVFHWQYQDCSQPDGCRQVTNVDFAKEILYGRNFLFSDIAYRLLQDSEQSLAREEKYELVLNSLQNSLVANLATQGVSRSALINAGYMPLRRMLKDFRESDPEFEDELMNLDYVLETNLLELHLAAARLPADLLVPIIANVPFDELADEMPEIVSEYERIAEDEFRRDLSQTKEHIREIDRIFEDESLFRSLVKKLLS